MQNALEKYRATIYMRLSKEDGDKEESNSISNQKALIREYLKSKTDIEICSEKVDDGYTGVDFDRPAFTEMMEDIRSGKINCIVVKDLSRFGRNYIEAGRYIEKIFPFMGVRFIAINDNYDSAYGGQSDNILIPFKNLINDAYCRDISIKIRSQLEIKRKKGEYISAFAPFGYLKSGENKNQLIIDDYAAAIVKNIFNWKICGRSNQSIADKLNGLGILSPMEYKKSIGLNYETSFKSKIQAKWTPVSIGRILKNEVYLGVLQQGKGSTPNYKVKKRVEKTKKDWIRVENVHEAIISKEEFERVNQLLLVDMRTSPKNENVHLLSGKLFCSDCGQSMIRKVVTAKGKQYVYYVCSANKYEKKCTTHCISERNLLETVFFAIKRRIENIMDIERIMNYIDTLPYKNQEVKGKSAQIEKKEEEIQYNKQLVMSLYEDFKAEIITKEEYIELKSVYSTKVEEEKLQLHKLQAEQEMLLKNTKENHSWINQYKKYQSIEKLDRKIIALFVDKIQIYEKERVEVTLSHREEYEAILRYLNQSDGLDNRLLEKVNLYEEV